MTPGVLIRLYNALVMAGLVPALALAGAASLVSEKRRKTVGPRLWLGGLAKRGGRRPVWIHALSVGEVRSALPLVGALSRCLGKERIVLSAATHTGYLEAVGSGSPLAGQVVFFPYDLIWSVRRAARSIDPALVIIVESDIWPNFLHVMARRRVPVVLANARLSDRSLAGYRRLGRVGRFLFDGFCAVCAQSAEDARRFKALGVDPGRIHVTGSTKFDQAVPLSRDPDADALRRRLGLSEKAPVLVAGSTHKGEEAVLAGAFDRIRSRIPSAKMVVAPRDPARAARVCRIFQSAGHVARTLSQPFPLKEDAVAVVDTMGLLAQLYAAADLAFVGGSLAPRGGHNPLEPAALGKGVLFGPDMGDFRSMARQLVTGGGACEVADEKDLAGKAAAILADPDAARQMGEKARAVFCAHRGAVARVLEVVAGVWPPASK